MADPTPTEVLGSGATQTPDVLATVTLAVRTGSGNLQTSTRLLASELVGLTGTGVTQTPALTISGKATPAVRTGSGSLQTSVRLATRATTVTTGTGTVQTVTVTAHPDNDSFADAEILTGASGSTPVNTVDGTSEVDEPVHGVDALEGVTSVWFVITVDDPSTVLLTVSPTTFDAVMDIWSADVDDTIDTMDLVATSNDVNGVAPEYSLVASVDTIYYIRIYPAVEGDSDPAAALDWTVTARTPTVVITADPALTVDSDTVLDFAPGLLMVTVANGEPLDTAEFTIDADPTILASEELDDTGSLINEPVPIPDVTVGVHTLYVSAGAASGSFEFTVLEVDPPDDDPDEADIQPEAGVPPRWVFYDPVADVAHPFVVNPATSGSPLGPWNIETEPTSAPDGQVVAWQGIRPGHPWQFGGWLLTQDEVENLRDVAEIRHRIWLVNHLGEGFVVLPETVDMKRVRDMQRPWLHSYEMTVIVMQGPVQL